MLLRLALTRAVAGGTAYVDPPQYTVQTDVTIDWVYVVGPDGFVPGDLLRVHDPEFHGMRWSRWKNPGLDPALCDDVTSLETVHTSGAATLSLERNTASSGLTTEAWSDVWVDAGALSEGDTITVRFGDTSSRPECAHLMPERAFHLVPFPADEQVGGMATPQPLAETPLFDVVAEEDVAWLHVVARSMMARGTADLLVVPMDVWGNPVKQWAGTLSVEAAYGGATASLTADDRGRAVFPVDLRTDGVHRIVVTATGADGVVTTARSNPILVSAAPPAEQVVWGDIHAHYGNAYLDEDGFYVDENHEYARDYAGLQYGCESSKTPSEIDTVEIDWEDIWADNQENCSALSADGTYVAMLGFEWMGGDFFSGGNHHNVYYDGCDGPQADPDLYDLNDLYAFLYDTQATFGVRTTTLPHATWSGVDWDRPDGDLRRAVEVYSGGWGDSMEGERKDIDQTVRGGIRLGERLGFFGSSDSHVGFMGNPVPNSGRYGYGGLGAIWTTAVDHEHLFEGIVDRRSYASTGSRIIADWDLTVGGARVIMGESIIADVPTISWDVHAGDPIERLVIRAIEVAPKATDTILYEITPKTEDHAGTWTWSAYPGGAWAVWIEVHEAEHRAWLSPIWLDTDCSLGSLDPDDRCDADGDGYFSTAMGGDDCDDSDPDVHPGVPGDVWYDGVDVDCSGSDYDQDGDGADAEPWGPDCDDLDARINPSMREVYYDGVDSDCDHGSDYDADRDGYDAVAYGGDDCDDAEPSARPGATEVWYDDVDGDCSGGSDWDQDGDGEDADPVGPDCDDTDPTIGTFAVEVWYDGVDGDCDGGSDGDADGDGADATAFGGDDCDDTDEAIGPGAVEVWYDGLDQDCDGRSDYDADLDGHDASEFGGDDCDDEDDAVHPGAEEVWYDGRDADCDGGDDFDADGDGAASADHDGDDCDDEDDTIHPGAEDAPYDGVDSDCDGGSDFDADGDGVDALPEGADCNDADPAVTGDGDCLVKASPTACGGCATGSPHGAAAALLALTLVARRSRRR